MSTSGIFVRTGDLAELLEDLKRRSVRLLYLREDGGDFRCLKDEPRETEMAFVLGDHTGMTAEEESLLASVGVEVVALGPTSLHADHCIVVTNWLLDTNAFMSDRG
jgi:tRNA (pseudouridine54-N1)-methyltransferase